jgi:hypothetical protein
MQQIAAQEQFLWGGGAWTGTPAAGSMWALQDEQRAMGYQSQMASFAASRQRADLRNQFAIGQEQIQLGRMQTSQEMQRYNFGFQWSGMQLQRGWTREDWQMQDTRRGLNFGWQMEDINEAIRFAGGRERRQLLRQRGRMATTYSLDEEQISKQRDRQEQLWAREDERFQKQVQYAERMMAYDQEQWEHSKKQRETFFEFERKQLARHEQEYKKRFELEDEIIELQRDHQAHMLELQKAAAGVQAEAAEVQHDLQKVMTENSRTFGDIEGYMENINSYEKLTKNLNMLNSVMGNMDKLSADKLNGMIRAFALLGSITPAQWKALAEIADGSAKYD